LGSVAFDDLQGLYGQTGLVQSLDLASIGSVLN
jgi:hypothetical protein